MQARAIATIIERDVDDLLAYVEQQLVPVLCPGDIVVMDNLGSHEAGPPGQASGKK